MWQLELLLFFRKKGADASVDDVSSANYLDGAMAEKAVHSLVAANLLAETTDGMYRYMPSSDKSKLVDELARAYANSRAAVIELIYSTFV